MNDSRDITNAPPGNRLAVVVLNFNGLKDTLECLESFALARDANTSIIVVDNGSIECPETAIRKTYPWVTYLQNTENLGWSGGNNTGIRHAMADGADWIALVNNDTVVSDQFVKRHRDVCEANLGFAVYGPMINEYDARDRLQTAICWFNREGFPGFFESEPYSPARQSPPLIRDTDIVNGCCMFIRRDVVEKIGIIDDAYYLIHEESDFCLRAKEAGFRLGVLAEPLIWHKHSVSFQRAGKRIQCYYNARNLRQLIRYHAPKIPTSRPLGQSMVVYWKHLLYVVRHQLDLDNSAGALAVVEGWGDSIMGRYGKRQERFRPLAYIAFIMIRVLLTIYRLSKMAMGKRPQRSSSWKFSRESAS